MHHKEITQIENSHLNFRNHIAKGLFIIFTITWGIDISLCFLGASLSTSNTKEVVFREPLSKDWITQLILSTQKFSEKKESKEKKFKNKFRINGCLGFDHFIHPNITTKDLVLYGDTQSHSRFSHQIFVDREIWLIDCVFII